ncbi:MAG: HlyD family efflux transporter periplasmic adaptor subunit [Fimbriimonadaceae bacterium]|nr:HlyD family efflux transporter periplasmic adaptor subunit [Chitinophagales bacterium]
MKLTRILIIVVIALIAFLIIGRVAGWFGSSKGLTVQMDTVQKRDIIETVTASGKIYPVNHVEITAEISGEIVELPVIEGGWVNAGDLLMRINPDIYESQVEQSQAGLDNTKAQLASAKSQMLQAKLQMDNAKITYDRSTQLFNDKVISASDYDQATLSYQTAKAQYEIGEEGVKAMEYAVKSSEAMLKEMRNNFKRTNIYAPVSGTVFGLNKKKGEKVLGTIQMTGDLLMGVADLNAMEVRVDVSENDVLRINLGDSALVEVDAYLDRKFRGIVTQIANSAGSNNALQAATEQATNFSVRITLMPESYADLSPKEKNAKYPFYPGMSATAEIKTNTAANILTVPIQAVTTKEDSSMENSDESIMEIVFTVVGDTVAETRVKTGLQDDDFIEIEYGLKEGDKIVSGPYNTVSTMLKQGDKVQEDMKKGEGDKK